MDEEPCFLDFRDAPELFEGDYEGTAPPSGMDWWEGAWPTGGINSPEELQCWIRWCLTEMISLQNYDSLAELGRLLGIQAIINADRWLGQFGNGDHPPRPKSSELDEVEDVENALEAILRYLRLQSRNSIDSPNNSKAVASNATLVTCTTPSSTPDVGASPLKKKNFLSKEEREIKVRECLIKNPEASSREVAKAAKISLGSVIGTLPWRVVMDQRNQKKPPPKKTPIPLTEKMIVLIEKPGDEDPADIAERRDSALKRLRTKYDESQLKNLQAMSDEQRNVILDMEAEDYEEELAENERTRRRRERS